MGLKVTDYGDVCPLGKFSIDVASGCGSYDEDPVKACFNCNFADDSVKEFNLEAICKCPNDLTWNEYDILRKGYASEGGGSREGFWNYVSENMKVVGGVEVKKD